MKRFIISIRKTGYGHLVVLSEHFGLESEMSRDEANTLARELSEEHDDCAIVDETLVPHMRFEKIRAE